MKRRVFSIIFLMLLSIYIGSATIKAAPPEGFDFNHVLNLIWTDQEAISQEGEFHLVSDEIDGMPYSIPMIANYSLTAVMGNIGAFNDVGAIYPGHSEAYAYYIFMVDIEELHFYSYKMQLKKTVPFDELVSITTEDPLVGNQTVFFEFKVDGQIYASQVVNKGDQLQAPADPIKEYHVFDGWYKDSQFNYLYDFNDIVVNGFNLYAKFSPGNITVNFYNGNTLEQSLSNITYGTTVQVMPSKPNVENYNKIEKTFDFSNKNRIINNSTNKITLSDIEWTWSGTVEILNDSIYLKKDGTLISEHPYSFNENITGVFGTFLGDGMSFLRFFISNDKVNWENIVTHYNTSSLKTVDSFNNKYIKIEGDNGYPKLLKIDFYSNPYIADEKTYIFDKWYYDQELTIPYNQNDVLYGNTNVYAGYVEKKFELSFNSNGGSPINSLFYYQDEEILMPEYNPSRIGYTFTGWYLDEQLEQEFNLETMPDDDVVLYAKWLETEETQFLIEFYLGEELYTYIVLAEEQELILPSAPPTAENQIFLGWYYDEEFTEQFKVTDPIEDDVTLYGKFGSGGSGGTETPPEETPGTEFKLEKKYVIIAAIVFIGIGLALIIRKRK